MNNKNNQITMKDQATEFLFYTTPNGEVKIEVFLQDENLWLTQERMAELFGVNRQAITKHLINIYKEGELEENSTCSILEQVQIEGNRQVKRRVKFYNLDAIIAVGYRVNSKKATQFRIWATKVIKEYIIKGFTMDDARSIRVSKNENLLQNISFSYPYKNWHFPRFIEKIAQQFSLFPANVIRNNRFVFF